MWLPPSLTTPPTAPPTRWPANLGPFFLPPLSAPPDRGIYSGFHSFIPGPRDSSRLSFIHSSSSLAHPRTARRASPRRPAHPKTPRDRPPLPRHHHRRRQAHEVMAPRPQPHRTSPRTSNIERPTSNIEVRNLLFILFPSTFDVRCSMFDVPAAQTTSSLPPAATAADTSSE
jgi:hypothetical protein